MSSSGIYMVKQLRDGKGNPLVHVMMLGEYGPGMKYPGSFLPVEISDPDSLFDIRDLNFTQEEVQEYVRKAFLQAKDFSHEVETLQTLCDILVRSCGLHVGMVAAAVRLLNQRVISCEKAGIPLPNLPGWIMELRCDVLLEPMAFERAAMGFCTLNAKELDILERIFYFEASEEIELSAQSSVRRCILVSDGNIYDFLVVRSRSSSSRAVRPPALHSEAFYLWCLDPFMK